MMAFMMKKKKYKFQVEVCVEELTAVPFVNAVLFAKVRLLDGGNFSETSSRQEVQNHAVRWGAKFEFVCKMSANASTGVLEPCAVRVSVRKELKGGRSFQKLGFSDLNLAEFAGAGRSVRRCLLEGYDTRHRQDNSMLKVAIRMNMLSGDILFKVPSSTGNQNQMASQEGVDRREDYSGGSIASGSSGFGSLPKKRSPLFSSELMQGSLPSETFAETALENLVAPDPIPPDEAHELGHSRNSSNTSQMSKASGYGSLNSQSQHSRQSSSGDSGHIRAGDDDTAPALRPPPPSDPGKSLPSPGIRHSPGIPRRSCAAAAAAAAVASASSSASVAAASVDVSIVGRCIAIQHRKILDGGSGNKVCPASINPEEQSHDEKNTDYHSVHVLRRTVTTNPSCGSGTSETGSLDRAKSTGDRKKKVEESAGGSGGRVEVTRVNPNSLIDELLRSTDLTQADESSESTGLQLFIAKDGTTALGSQDVVKCKMSKAGAFKQVVIEENR